MSWIYLPFPAFIGSNGKCTVGHKTFFANMKCLCRHTPWEGVLCARVVQNLQHLTRWLHPCTSSKILLGLGSTRDWAHRAKAGGPQSHRHWATTAWVTAGQAPQRELPAVKRGGVPKIASLSPVLWPIFDASVPTWKRQAVWSVGKEKAFRSQFYYLQCHRSKSRLGMPLRKCEGQGLKGPPQKACSKTRTTDILQEK